VIDGNIFGTADIRGKWPVNLSFARRVGGILDEYGDARDLSCPSGISFEIGRTRIGNKAEHSMLARPLDRRIT
jgi:hypothetical protein